MSEEPGSREGRFFRIGKRKDKEKPQQTPRDVLRGEREEQFSTPELFKQTVKFINKRRQGLEDGDKEFANLIPKMVAERVMREAELLTLPHENKNPLAYRLRRIKVGEDAEMMYVFTPPEKDGPTVFVGYDQDKREKKNTLVEIKNENGIMFLDAGINPFGADALSHATDTDLSTKDTAQALALYDQTLAFYDAILSNGVRIDQDDFTVVYPDQRKIPLTDALPFSQTLEASSEVAITAQMLKAEESLEEKGYEPVPVTDDTREGLQAVLLGKLDKESSTRYVAPSGLAYEIRKGLALPGVDDRIAWVTIRRPGEKAEQETTYEIAKDEQAQVTLTKRIKQGEEDAETVSPHDLEVRKLCGTLQGDLLQNRPFDRYSTFI